MRFRNFSVVVAPLPTAWRVDRLDPSQFKAFRETIRNCRGTHSPEAIGGRRSKDWLSREDRPVACRRPWRRRHHDEMMGIRSG